MDITDRMEREIRGAANDLSNAVTTRALHPTYGYTKTVIRSKMDRLDGMIFLYGVLTEQALNPMPGLVTFVCPRTTEVVRLARSSASKVVA